MSMYNRVYRDLSVLGMVQPLVKLLALERADIVEVFYVEAQLHSTGVQAGPWYIVWSSAFGGHTPLWFFQIGNWVHTAASFITFANVSMDDKSVRQF